MPEARELVVAEFAGRDKQVLATIALVDRQRVVFADRHSILGASRDFPWHGDDASPLNPEDFELVFLLQRGSSYTLGLAMSGEEGVNLFVFVSNAAGNFTNVIADYWYLEPV
jgi:hypothetical protein